MFNHYVLLIVILFFFANCGADSKYCQKVSLDYLDAAADFIAKAKSHFPSQVICENNKTRNATDCSELLAMGYKKSGVYTIWPKNRIIDGKPLEVYCDMETDRGGWTLIQRRGDFGGAMEDFGKDWKSYKEGFGDIQKEFWLGNDNIFGLTNRRLYSVRFDLRTLDNVNMYAQYDTFWIDDENYKYNLHIDSYSGNAGDAMYNHKNHQFSAKASINCPKTHTGGWWYQFHCYSNLNGRLHGGMIIWYANFIATSLQASEIKIRPRNFKHHYASLNYAPM